MPRHERPGGDVPCLGLAGRLDDKVVLITGTGGGQGRAAAELFAAEGAKVVGCDVDAAGNERTVEVVTAAGGEMVGMAPVDLGDGAQSSYVTGADFLIDGGLTAT